MHIGEMDDGSDNRLLRNDNAKMVRSDPIMQRRLHPCHLTVGGHTNQSASDFDESFGGREFLQFIRLPQPAHKGANE